MKRYFLSILLAVASLSAFAQDPLYLWKSGQVVMQMPISSLDSIGFTAPQSTLINGYEYVDLGLPSGTLWATCNIGATSPEEIGDYFRFGETEPYSPETSLPFVDVVVQYGLYEIAGTMYDAARVQWGVAWSTPSAIQAEEMRQYCRTYVDVENGVRGWRIVGPNGRSIFMPFSGQYYQNGSFSGGDGAMYHTSSYYTDCMNCKGVWLITLDRQYFSVQSASWTFYYACNIRPVAMLNPNVYTIVTYGDRDVYGTYGTISGGGEYVEGTTILLKATPNEGYQFSGWSDGNTDNPRVVQVTADATYTANFVAISNE